MADAGNESQDLLEHLTEEHRQLEQMWAQLQDAHQAGADQEGMGREIVKALSQHDALELQLLYPALERAGDGTLADHAREDHAEIRRLLDEVDGKDPADEVVFSTFTRIIASVRTHVAEEEGTMFPVLRASLSVDELVQLGKRSEQAEKVAPTHPHPTTPDGPVGATVVGAAAGLMDKARDALKRR